MKYVVQLAFVVDTDDYADVKSKDDVKELAASIIKGEDDWPTENVKIGVYAYAEELESGEPESK